MVQKNITDVVLESNPIIIDIRSNYYHSLGLIRGAISVPYYNLLNNYSHYLNKSNKYYLYCDIGEQSLEIAMRLRKFGYNTYSIKGGYQEYLRFISL